MTDKLTPIFKPVQSHFRDARSLLRRTTLIPSDQNIPPSKSPRLSHSSEPSFTVAPPNPDKSFPPKSYAQVATLVAQNVLPKSCELRSKSPNEKQFKSKRPPPKGVRYASYEEIRLVETKAATAGLSPNAFIRAVTLGSDYRPPSDPELTRALLTLNRELTAQGNNLNQIARQLNGHVITEAQGHSMLDILGHSIVRTHKAVRKALAHGEPEPEP